MSTVDWDKLWSDFHHIVTLDRRQRKRALADLPDDEAAEIASLLDAHDQEHSLLDQPVLLENDVAQGHRIGPWKLQSLLGQGGMGQVWLAERADGAYKREVAIKLLALGLPNRSLIERFARERELLARLDHPNIAGLIDGGTLDNGQPYLVMERVKGRDLMTYSSDAALPIRQRLILMRKVCAALDHAHRRLIIHRDLKPANILVTDKGEPKLLDFGIARLLDPDHHAEQTMAAERRLTLEYASPEQLRGDPADARSDVFSLGVLLFELLVGQRPWRTEGLHASQVHDRVTSHPPARPSLVAARPTLRRDLDWIVARAIEPDPERRYADARELGDDLQRHLDGFPIRARPPNRLYRIGRFVGRHPWGVGASALILAIVLTAGSAHWLQSRALAVALNEAEQQSQRAGSLAAFLAELLVEADPEVHQGDPRTVEEVLAQAAERIAQDFDDQPRLKAELLTTLAEIFFNRGDYPRADNLVAEAIARTASDDLPRARLLRARLALVDGRYDDALTQTDELLAATDPEITARTRLLRAEAYQAMDDLDAAARALGGIEALGQEGDAAIEAWFRQGGLHWGRGDFSAAEASYRKALALQVDAHGEQSSQAARGLNAVASARYRQGDLDTAESLFRQVLERHETVFGPSHPQTAGIRVRLGALLYDRRRYEPALDQLSLALHDQQRAFADGHVALANTHNNLALVLAALERFADAERHFTEALTINEATHGPEHSRVAGNLANLGWMKIEQGRADEAKPLLLDALERQRSVFGDAHPQIAYTLHHLGRAALRSGQHNEAGQWLEQALSMRKGLLGPDHPTLAETRLLLAEERQAAGDTAAALQHIRIAARLREAQFGLEDPRREELSRRINALEAALEQPLPDAGPARP